MDKFEFEWSSDGPKYNEAYEFKAIRYDPNNPYKGLVWTGWADDLRGKGSAERQAKSCNAKPALAHGFWTSPETERYPTYVLVYAPKEIPVNEYGEIHP